MIDLLKTILEFLQGQQVSAAFAFVVILSVLVSAGYFIYKFLEKSVLNTSNDTGDKKNKNNDVENVTPEEWLKSEEGSKYLKSIIMTNIRLNDDRIVEKVSGRIKNDLKIQIFEETKLLYERISQMREEYAGNYLTRKEMDSIVIDVNEVRVQVAKIKGHLDID